MLGLEIVEQIKEAYVVPPFLRDSGNLLAKNEIKCSLPPIPEIIEADLPRQVRYQARAQAAYRTLQDWRVWPAH